MKAVKIIIILLFTMLSPCAFAQTFEDANLKSEYKSFENLNSEQNYLSSLDANSAATSNQDNTVFISQVGNNNEINSSTNATTSDISYFQTGNTNTIVVDLRSEVIIEKINQTGNHNSLFDYNIYRNEFHNVDVQQNGNNQNLTMYGGNTISEQLKITMQGQNQTIIVRNFN